MEMANSSFRDFIDDFIPTLRSSLSAMTTMALVRHRLDDLMSYYIQNPIQSSSYSSTGRTTLVTMNGDWVAEVKGAALFADRIIVEDPLLYSADLHELSYDKDTWAFDEESERQTLLERIGRTLDQLDEVMPFINEGILVFYPLRRPELVGMTSNSKSAIRAEMREYLIENMGTRNVDYFNNYCRVEIRIPLIEAETTTTFRTTLLWDREMSIREAAAYSSGSVLSFNYYSAICGMRAADLTNGTFWTSRDWYWRICESVAGSLAPHAKIYSFIQSFARPALESVRTKDIISIRRSGDAFHNFRKEMLLTESLLKSLPSDSEAFNDEAASLFDDAFGPSFSAIESAMKRNVLLKGLPWFAASSGFAYIGAASSGSHTAATVFGTLSAALGFGPMFAELVNRERVIRREPAYVFWKLDQIKTHD